MTQNKEMNYDALMQARLPEHIYKLLRAIGDASKDMGYSAYVVGGFVRDLILGRPNLDVDIVIEGDGIDFADKFAEINKAKAKSHKQFGTAVVTLKDGFKIDIATARTEIYEHPGALPTVKFASIKDDLIRRDFTINAMAIEINSDRFGNLVDFLNGISDLDNKVIRIIHDLSFSDDPTRIFRAIRFEQRFSFSMDKHTEELLRKAVKSNFLDMITKQRLRNELLLILREDNPLTPLVRMSNFGLMRHIHPLIRFNVKLLFILSCAMVRKEAYKHFPDINDNVDYALIFLCVLLDQLNDSQTQQVAETLHLNRKYKEVLKLSKTRLNEVLKNLNGSIPPSRIYRLLSGLPLEILILGLIKSQNSNQTKSITSYFDHIRKVKPLINGDDLKELGYPESPLYTEILSKTFSAQLDGIIKDKRQAIEFINKHYIR